jgi:hypothetical protein
LDVSFKWCFTLKIEAMLSIAVVAAAIAARRGFFEPAATEHGGAARMAVAGDFLVLRARRGCG